LERQGPYAVVSVARAAVADDPDLAMFACQVLGGIGGRSSIEPLLLALARPEVNVVQAAAEALGRLRLRETVPALTALLDREPWLQLAAADALGAIGDPAAVDPLLSLVPHSLIAEAALDALARIAAPAALERFLGVLEDSKHASLRAPLVRAIGAVLDGSDAPADLTEFGRRLESDHGPASLWQFLAERLSGGVEDPELPGRDGGVDDRGQHRGGTATLRGAAALVLAAGAASLLPLVLRWAEDRDARGWVIPMVQRHAARVAGPAMALLGHPDTAVRGAVVRTLPPGTLGMARLLTALADAAFAVRIAACDALGALRDAGAVEPLAALLAGGTAPERGAAAAALCRCGGSEAERVLSLQLDPASPEVVLVPILSALAASPITALDDLVLAHAASAAPAVRRAALRAIARIPGSRAEVVLLRALADRDPGLQMEALDLLVTRGGDRVRTTLLALLGAGDSLRYHVIRALGRLAVSEAAGPLEALFTTAPLHERIEIVSAVARIAGPGARAFLLQCLEQAQPEIRRVAAQGLALAADQDDLDLLRRLARDGDWVIRSEAARAFGRLDLEVARAALVDLARDLEPTVARTARAALAR
jgi:HEAT repeat protein